MSKTKHKNSLDNTLFTEKSIRDWMKFPRTKKVLSTLFFFVEKDIQKTSDPNFKLNKREVTKGITNRLIKQLPKIKKM